ncbi:MAG: YihA family ribosome biogenesis GTP-binding protein [Erysipelotrichaceae bacterium]|jgi:GTP-binding protein|nr:ribosome biogenesis GTP-binding protein YihA/YsxC [Bacilli bacterium]NLV28564.1 YihA family ribosome biogenesis GTP-binding protein [Erysipelotrichaceae bacterium]HPY79426.1 ribosome biogenesis GTP-binding protein YihA/YsxC [Bacilli bacterium]HQA55494.1 ribosome biogenesis GTP-binding protein YihA/YsxC [Bacilli bacterium]
MINFQNVTFIKSAPSYADAPEGMFPEVLIVGKSNVGKSTLINTLCQRNRLAYTSSKPGHTRLLNYYLIDEKFYLVDAPGYGYARGGVDLDALFGKMMEDYFTNCPRLKLVLILIDARREFNVNDEEILTYVQENKIPYFVIVTKVDKVNQSEKHALVNRLKEKNITEDALFYTSSLRPKTIESLKSAIEKVI